jgi:gluconolactonase
MRKPIETLAEGLGHPEGPDILPDGRIIMVETYTSKLIAWSAERGIHDYADCGGGPNACMLGSDGAVYITQNGGTVGAWRAQVMGRPSIQKAWPDGRVEEVAAAVGGIQLQAPNDLTFGPDGRLYFTDPADYQPNDRRPGRVFVLEPDGTGELLEELPEAYPNGIAAEPDGSIVWVESYERGVYRRPPDGPSELLVRLPEGHTPDGLKVAANGDLWITTFMGGGIDIVAPDGTIRDFLETGGVPLNCVFHDRSLIITDFGDITAVTDAAPMGGRLWRVDVGVEGMPLFRGAIGS